MLKSALGALVKFNKKEIFSCNSCIQCIKIVKSYLLILIFFYFPFWVCLTNAPNVLFSMTHKNIQPSNIDIYKLIQSLRKKTRRFLLSGQGKLFKRVVSCGINLNSFSRKINIILFQFVMKSLFTNTPSRKLPSNCYYRQNEKINNDKYRV
jgi:amino acid permease